MTSCIPPSRPTPPRFATLMLESEISSNNEMRNLPNCVLGYKSATHDIEYNRPADFSGQWDRWWAQQHACFWQRLRSTPKGEGNMLDRTVVLWGSAHPHAFEGTKKVPLANLFMSLLNAVDVPVKSFADSTGPMTEIRN